MHGFGWPLSLTLRPVNRWLLFWRLRKEYKSALASSPVATASAE